MRPLCVAVCSCSRWVCAHLLQGSQQGQQQRRHFTALHVKTQDASSTRTLCRMSVLSPLCVCSCELLPVALDDLGLVPSHLDALLTARQAAGQPMPKLLYTIPTGEANTARRAWSACWALQDYKLACFF